MKVLIVEQPRIAVATKTSTAHVRVVLYQPATSEDGAGHIGVGRSLRFECVWEIKLEYIILFAFAPLQVAMISWTSKIT